MTDFHTPYTFDSRETYLAACKRWAADYERISAERRQMKRDIVKAMKEGHMLTAANLQYSLWAPPKDATVMLQKRAAMKEEAARQVEDRKFNTPG